MLPYADSPRLLAGKVLLVFGVGLLAVWTFYFADLARSVDAWDFSPLLVAVAAILIGVKLMGLDRLLRLTAVSWKRDLVPALALGAIVELGLWAFLFVAVKHPDSAERYFQLERLQEPGGIVGLTIYRHLYSYIGGTWARNVCLVCAFTTLIAIWSVAVLALLRIFRLFCGARS
jgi:hypothetical protein